MKLRPSLVLLLASLCQTAQATTLVGTSIIEPITYTVEDLDLNDGITATAKLQDWYPAEVELNVYGMNGYGSASKILNGTDRFARASMAPSPNFNYGVYGGGDLGSMVLFSNFTEAAVNYGKLLNARHFQVPAHTRMRFKTRIVLQGQVLNQGPAMPEMTELSLTGNVITYLNSMPYQNILVKKVLTQQVGKLIETHPVEMEVSNTSDYPNWISIYYETTNFGVYGE